MKPHASLAIFLIALCGITTGASAEEVYRCGNAYSQKPCPDGVRVDVQDARTAEQKAESDKAIRRESSAANAMEKARLQEEAQLRTANAKAAAPSKDKKKASKPTPPDAAPVDTKAHKPHAKKKKEPEYFTASGPRAEKPKAAASKAK